MAYVGVRVHLGLVIDCGGSGERETASLELFDGFDRSITVKRRGFGSSMAEISMFLSYSTPFPAWLIARRAIP